MKTRITFNNTAKGQKAEAKYNTMIKEGWSIEGALETLIIHGYGKEFKTNLYI